MEMMPVTLYYSERMHNYVSDLQRMLDLIGGYDAPLYHHRPHFVAGIREGVICQLTLRPRTTADGQRQPPRRFFQARRKQMEDGVQETARIAMLRLARIHATDLAGTPYRLHPAGSLLDDEDPWHSALEQEEDETVTHLARFAFSQAHLAERTATELQQTHQALDSARERIAELEEAIHARDNEEEEEENNVNAAFVVLALPAQPLEEEMAEKMAEVAEPATPPPASPPSTPDGSFRPCKECTTPEHTAP